MAQPGSALDWGSRGRRFESCRSDHFRFSDLICELDGRLRNSEAARSVSTPQAIPLVFRLVRLKQAHRHRDHDDDVDRFQHALRRAVPEKIG